jgi:hypothetical protein
MKTQVHDPGKSAVFTAAVMLCTLCPGFAAGDEKAVYVTFDAPGAGTANYQGTYGESINAAGTVAGSYLDSNFVYHGFVRAANGDLTVYDAPGAGTVGYAGTDAAPNDSGINGMGAAVGTSLDNNYHATAYQRDPGGAVALFQVAGAGSGSNQGTYNAAINDGGSTAGVYIDSNGYFHGYVRYRNGQVTTFDAPITDAEGTGVNAMNSSGAIVGSAVDANGAEHAYVRYPDGKITMVTVPGEGSGAGQGSYPFGINSAGLIAGTMWDDTGATHGFLRKPTGDVTVFDVPGFTGPWATGLDDEGRIAGFCYSTTTVYGFLRQADGTFVTFNVPGAVGTNAQSISAGMITGYYWDSAGMNHGFVRLP